MKTFYVNGIPPAAGTIFRNPDLAKTFGLIQQQGRDAFYKGEVARAIVAKSTALGGTMTLDDLANYKGEWVTPASTTYHDQFTSLRDDGAVAGMGNRGGDERSGAVRADLVSRPDACLARTGESALLARVGRDQEGGLRRPVRAQRRPERGVGADRRC